MQEQSPGTHDASAARRQETSGHQEFGWLRQQVGGWVGVRVRVQVRRCVVCVLTRDSTRHVSQCGVTVVCVRACVRACVCQCVDVDVREESERVSERQREESLSEQVSERPRRERVTARERRDRQREKRLTERAREKREETRERREKRERRD